MATPLVTSEVKSYFDAVYEPAEDSFLMLDALESDLDNIKAIRPTICLEVGSGSGIVITFLAMQLGNNASYFCTDVNKLAVKATLKLSGSNNVSVEPVLMDLVTSFDPRLCRNVDVLLFNPPYVETPDSEVGSDRLSASWAGGIKGRKTMDRFFPFVDYILTSKGRFYLLTLDVNDNDEIENLMSKMTFEKKTVISRRCGREKLTVTCFTRSAKPCGGS